MTERDIRGFFATLPAPEDDSDVVVARILEEGFVILNRMAEALESIALDAMRRPTP